MQYPLPFIKEIPKTDLHLHLDGSLRLPTLIELAREYQVELPSYTEAGLKEKVFKDAYANLGEYLKGFYYTVNCLCTAEALERVAYELVRDCITDGVRYIEVRFAPQLHIRDGFSYEQIMDAVNRGLKRGKDEYNRTPEVTAKQVPPFHYGIIVCALRMFMPAFSPYYRQLFEVSKYSPENFIFRSAAMELARATVKLMAERPDIPVAGFDLAGQENGYPAVNYKKAYEFCHRNFVKKTVHAGEAYGAESIFQAITDLHADRIGHGYYLFDTEKIQNREITDRDGYIRKLVNYIANNRVTIEVCLTSNLQTNPGIGDIKNHTLQKMLDSRLSITLCTDNLLVSSTTVSREIGLAVNNFKIKPSVLKDIIIYGFKRNFYCGSYAEKRDYCRTIIDYYEQIERKYDIQSSVKQ